MIVVEEPHGKRHKRRWTFVCNNRPCNSHTLAPLSNIIFISIFIHLQDSIVGNSENDQVQIFCEGHKNLAHLLIWHYLVLSKKRVEAGPNFWLMRCYSTRFEKNARLITFLQVFQLFSNQVEYQSNRFKFIIFLLLLRPTRPTHPCRWMAEWWWKKISIRFENLK